MLKLTMQNMTSLNYFLILCLTTITRRGFVRYKKIKITKIIYTSRQAFVESMSGVCPNGKYAVFFTAYTQRFWCSGRPPNTGGLGFLSPSPSLLLLSSYLS
jgi:hypothetical protein